jgi:peptide/nickel transport system ATP-binding protein
MQAEAVRPETAVAPILEVRALAKQFKVGGSRLPWGKKSMLHAIDDVSFSLQSGKIVALVGETGSGKSTVARVLARLYQPTSGQIFFHGEDIRARSARDADRQYRSQVQMIFQDPFGSLNPVKRVEHHIARPLLIHTVVPRNQVRERVRELLTMVGLVPADEIARQYPHQLSGGQRQRVNIARALAPEPEILLADEPISMLDVSIRIGILNIMLDLKERKNLAFLYITHDIASARYVADEVMVMYAGQVVERGETDTVLQKPLHPYTRMLLSAVPNPQTGLAGGRIESIGEAHAAINPKDQCRFLSRCPLAVEASHCSTPKLVEVEPNHWVRCHLYPGS